MEYHFPADVTAEKATTRVMPLIAGDEYNPCPIIGNIYTSSCYFSLPSWWIDVLQKDEKKMEELCSDAPGQTVQRFCFLGIGYAFAPALQYDVAAVEQRCDAMEKIQEQTLCRAGASFAFFANENERINAPALCDFPGQRGKDCINAADLLALQGA